mmetsp:Transcript_6694/g.28035  ORF Transcript_6694/g.28035 Transcript_6694/m.28035 type:complete len:609 (+) Transcript_6694:5487-7313(+)
MPTGSTSGCGCNPCSTPRSSSTASSGVWPGLEFARHRGAELCEGDAGQDDGRAQQLVGAEGLAAHRPGRDAGDQRHQIDQRRGAGHAAALHRPAPGQPAEEPAADHLPQQPAPQPGRLGRPVQRAQRRRTPQHHRQRADQAAVGQHGHAAVVLDQRPGGHGVVAEQRRGDEQGQVAERGLPVGGQQLVRREQQRPGGGRGHAGDLAARKPLQPAQPQDQQREHRPAGQQHAGAEGGGALHAIGRQQQVQALAHQRQPHQRADLGAVQPRPAPPEPPTQQGHRAQWHQEIAQAQEAGGTDLVEQGLGEREVQAPGQHHGERGEQGRRGGAVGHGGGFCRPVPARPDVTPRNFCGPARPIIPRPPRPETSHDPRHQDRCHPRPRLQHAGGAGADDPGRRRCRAPELLPRQGPGPHRPSDHGPRGGGPRRQVGGHHGRPAGPQDPRRQVRERQDRAHPRRQVHPRRRPHRARQPRHRQPRLQGAAARCEARRHAAAERRPAGADRRGRAWRPGAHHRQARRRAVQQQGHQQAGRRPDRAGPDRQGHGRHQDRDVLPVRIPRGELPEERHRHGDGPPARQRGRRALPPQAVHDRQDRALRGHPPPRGHPEGV